MNIKYLWLVPLNFSWMISTHDSLSSLPGHHFCLFQFSNQLLCWFIVLSFRVFIFVLCRWLHRGHRLSNVLFVRLGLLIRELYVNHCIPFFENLIVWSILSISVCRWVPGLIWVFFPQTAWVLWYSYGSRHVLPVPFVFKPVSSRWCRLYAMRVFLEIVLKGNYLILLRGYKCLQLGNSLVKFLVQSKFLFVAPFKLNAFFVEFNQLCRRKVLFVAFPQVSLLQVDFDVFVFFK